ncbi:ABC transporter permease [Micromonospora thermarum]|uniref:ABC transporter permease n=1 Tax=Micromonospora thermarum TaxID=2720024 RepID=UPI00281521B4|nr:ABC transporter permease [Micromonospora thermarum]
MSTLAAAGVLLLFLLAVSWLSAAFGLLARTPEAASGVTFLVMFLPYPSSAFVPVETMPAWLRGFADHQPVTPVIETLRALLLATPGGDGAGPRGGLVRRDPGGVDGARRAAVPPPGRLTARQSARTTAAVAPAGTTAAAVVSR